MEPLYLGQVTKNPFTNKSFLVITFYNEKNGLYETHVMYFSKKLQMLEVPVQRYKMRTEALRGHNAWLRTLRQEDFALRDVDTAELYIFTKEGSII